ncbi:MAG TPA: TerC/Alx family metal homeostasis membrane protein, partial [Kofleriaceae bacterium]|nr:TerC/Alx family metal homeostasis membrane protein [Kofleriaceae bacterium]
IYENSLGGAGYIDARHHLRGGDAAILYLTGYLLEESLSVDNLFVISLLFRSMGVPGRYQHRLLFWGIMGALVFRGTMIAGGVWLVSHFTWTFYLFGLFLVVSGVRMILAGDDDEPEPEASWFFKAVRRVLPMAKQSHGSRFLSRENGRIVVTHLAIALLAIELTDIVFAVDSVPAILSVTQEPFIVVTSNVFAILGLRSLYFVLAGMMNKFRYLKTALSILLVVIGGKMLAHDFLHDVPMGTVNLISLAVVVTVVSTGVIVSLMADAREVRRRTLEMLAQRPPSDVGDVGDVTEVSDVSDLSDANGANHPNQSQDGSHTGSAADSGRGRSGGGEEP